MDFHLYILANEFLCFTRVLVMMSLLASGSSFKVDIELYYAVEKSIFLGTLDLLFVVFAYELIGFESTEDYE